MRGRSNVDVVNALVVVDITIRIIIDTIIAIINDDCNAFLLSRTGSFLRSERIIRDDVIIELVFIKVVEQLSE